MDPAWSVDGCGATVTQHVPHLRALPLTRLDSLLEQVWDHRLTLIVAPAGSGKSTLLGRFVADAPGPVAWYRADAWDRDPVRMLRRLESALRTVVPALPTGWETMEDALDSLIATELPAGLLLVIDDLHALASTDAERRLERLIERAPSGLTVIAASRSWPDMNLPRFKVAGELLEIGVADLRFRSWEVERLFRDVYGQRSAARGGGRPDPAHGGLGRGAAAVPPRQPRQAAGRAEGVAGAAGQACVPADR